MDAAQELAAMEEMAALEEAMRRPKAPDFPAMLDKAKDVAGFGLKSGKQAVGGFFKGLAGAASAHPVLGPVMNLAGGSPQAMERLFPPDAGETPEEKLHRKTMEGVGGGLTVPGMGIVAPGLAGATGGLGAELGGRFGKKVDPKNPWMENIGSFVGGLVGGLPTAFALGPRQSVAQGDIRRETAGIPAADWATAGKNVDLFNDVGSTSATLAEAFPGKTRIAALANKAANAKGGEMLGQRLSGRDGDLQAMGDSFQERIGRPVEPATVATELSNASDAFGANLDNLATQGVTNSLKGKTVRAMDVAEIYRNLLQKAVQFDKEQPSLAPVYREVADQLLAKDIKGRPVGFVTDLQGLSFQLKNLKNSPVSPNAGAGSKGADAMWRKAIGEAEGGLAAKSPIWKQAMDDFAAFQEGPIAAFDQSAIRRVGSPNPNFEKPPVLSKLPGFMSGNSPSTIKSNAQSLADPALTQGATVQPLRVARAIAQEKLNGGSLNPGKTMRNLPGSNAEAQFNALLEAGGADIPRVNAPLRAADQLQGLTGPSGISGFPEMRSAQALIRPFRTLDMMMTGQTERTTQREISRLLANPTQAGLAKLKEIAMFDPNVRRQLSLLSALRPGLFNSQEQ